MNRQLPVGTCLGHAVKSVRNNIRHAFRISWPWLLILILLGGIVTIIFNYAGENNFVASFSALLVWLLVAMMAGAAIAVHWHRYILVDEISRVSEILRVDNKTWRYFGNVLLIAIIVSAVQIVVMLPVRAATWATATGELVESFLSLIVALVAGVLSYRLGVKLPAIALDRGDYRFADAWQATRGNDLRLLFVFLIQLVVSLIIFFVVYSLLISLAVLHPALGVIGFVIFFVFLWLLSIFNITILTSLYGFFVEGRDF